MVLRAAGPSNRDLDTIQSHMADASNTSALLLAQAVASLSRSELRWELANIAAAVAIQQYVKPNPIDFAPPTSKTLSKRVRSQCLRKRL